LIFFFFINVVYHFLEDLFFFGENSEFQSGETETNNNTINEIQIFKKKQLNVKKICSGDFFSLFLTGKFFL
jgi:hypothetical protein